MFVGTLVSPRDLRDMMVEEGIQFASSTEIGEWIGCSPAQVSTRLRGARQANEMLCVTNGGWVPVVSPKRLNVKTFIDPMMRHLGYEYYITGMSGAAAFGAAHQAVFATHIATSGHVRSRVFGGVSRLRVFRKEDASIIPTQQKSIQSWTGHLCSITVGTPEVILFDLFSTCNRLFIDSQLNAFCEFLDPGLKQPSLIDADRIAATGLLYSLQTRQRVGFLLEKISNYVKRDFDLDPLRSTMPSHLRMVELEKCPDKYDPPVAVSGLWGVRQWDDLHPDITC